MTKEFVTMEPVKICPSKYVTTKNSSNSCFYQLCVESVNRRSLIPYVNILATFVFDEVDKVKVFCGTQNAVVDQNGELQGSVLR